MGEFWRIDEALAVLERMNGCKEGSGVSMDTVFVIYNTIIDWNLEGWEARSDFDGKDERNVLLQLCHLQLLD